MTDLGYKGANSTTLRTSEIENPKILEICILICTFAQL